MQTFAIVGCGVTCGYVARCLLSHLQNSTRCVKTQVCLRPNQLRAMPFCDRQTDRQECAYALKLRDLYDLAESCLVNERNSKSTERRDQVSKLQLILIFKRLVAQVTYPLDTLRLRLAVDPSLRGVRAATAALLREGGGPALYRGLGIAVLGATSCCSLRRSRVVDLAGADIALNKLDRFEPPTCGLVMCPRSVKSSARWRLPQC